MRFNLKKFILIISKKWPSIIIILNIVLGYIILIKEDILNLKNNNSLLLVANNRYYLFIFLNLFLFMALVCYIALNFNTPGKVEINNSKDQMDMLIKEYLEEIKNNNLENGLFRNLISFESLKKTTLNDKGFLKFLKKNDYKFCKHCFIIKPERAHHCRYCNTCYLKMDHHCHWIDKCIGLGNYKSFCLLVLYYELYLIFYIILYWNIFIKHYFLFQSEIYFFLISLNCMVNCFLLLLNTLLFSLHFFKLSSNNQTTIEYCESKKNKDYYNKGIINNFSEIFGKNIFFLFLPLNYDNKANKKYTNLKSTDFIVIKI